MAGPFDLTCYLLPASHLPVDFTPVASPGPISSHLGEQFTCQPHHLPFTLLSRSPAAGCQRQTLLRTLKGLHSLAASPSIIRSLVPIPGSRFLFLPQPPTAPASFCFDPSASFFCPRHPVPASSATAAEPIDHRNHEALARGDGDTLGCSPPRPRLVQSSLFFSRTRGS